MKGDENRRPGIRSDARARVQDHKYQHKESVVKHVPTGKYYSYGISRSGSPFTDWYYSYEDGDFPDLTEVEKKERVITETYWSVV